jgi:hypothetical protein
MKKYRVGEQIEAGAQIDDITRLGVVLSANGERFVVTR